MTNSDHRTIRWYWFIVAAIPFIAIPSVLLGPSGHTLAAFVSGVIVGKWLTLGIATLVLERPNTAKRLMEVVSLG